MGKNSFLVVQLGAQDCTPSPWARKITVIYLETRCHTLFKKAKIIKIGRKLSVGRQCLAKKSKIFSNLFDFTRKLLPLPNEIEK